MQYPSAALCIVILGVVCSLVRSAELEKREISASDESMLPKKRPFCNAFTGCGRKRSDGSLVDAENDLLLEKLSQQILALVHLLEALHARIEVTKQQPMAEESARIFNYLAARKRRSSANREEAALLSEK